MVGCAVVTRQSVAVVAVLAAPRPAKGARLVLGVSSNYQYASTRPNMSHDLGAAVGQGVRSIREDFLWQYVQPSAGVWEWARYDSLVADAARLGVEVLPIAGYGATWATGGDRVMPSTDAARATYATYAAAIATRYGPGGTFWAANPNLTPRPIQAVELWNEPWYPNPTSVERYAALVRAAATAVHGAAPGVKVLASADDRYRVLLDGTVAHWIRALFAAEPNLAAWVDGWSIHPYARDERSDSVTAAQDTVVQVQYLRQQLAARGFGGDVWVTELGFRAMPTDASPNNSPDTARADMDAAMAGLAQLSGSLLLNRVTRVYAFTMARPTAGSSLLTAWDYGYNLVTATGQPTPALDAFTTASCQFRPR